MNQQTPLKTHASKCHAFINPENECVCDGYHTFNELYEHRFALWQALLSAFDKIGEEWGREGIEIWKSKLHSDGTHIEGWFVSGLGKDKGSQITYHLPISLWDDCYGIELEKAPDFDGHTSDDVLNRLKQI